MTVGLIILAVAFAWSMGAHYTGACMGMPYALHTISRSRALLVMAPLALLGAAFASHAVEHTVADRLTIGQFGRPAEIIVVAMAFALTTIFTRLKIPTSTIQILVFCVIGAALGEGRGVHWPTIGLLAVTWAAAPVVACGLGFAFVRMLDTLRLSEHPQDSDRTTRIQERQSPYKVEAPSVIAIALVAVGAGASFVMGSNDVANATGSLVATRIFSPLVGGAVGGAGLALGVLTWGRPLLERIAFEIVRLDRTMATAAQSVQALVVIVAVSFGLFTSMNQALVGAMTGAGLARGRETVSHRVLRSILRGWLIGPGAGIALCFAITKAVVAAAGAGALH